MAARSRWGLVAAGAVLVLGSLGVALVEYWRLPKGSIWIVVAVTVGLVAAIRALTTRR